MNNNSLAYLDCIFYNEQTFHSDFITFLKQLLKKFTSGMLFSVSYILVLLYATCYQLKKSIYKSLNKKLVLVDIYSPLQMYSMAKKNFLFVCLFWLYTEDSWEDMNMRWRIRISEFIFWYLHLDPLSKLEHDTQFFRWVNLCRKKKPCSSYIGAM